MALIQDLKVINGSAIEWHPKITSIKHTTGVRQKRTCKNILLKRTKFLGL
jgi:hypothetical protein